MFDGNGGAELDTVTSFLSREKVELTTQRTNLVGADMGTVSSNYSQAEVQQQALLAASGKILGPSHTLRLSAHLIFTAGAEKRLSASPTTRVD